MQAGDAECDAVVAALNTLEGVTGMYCDSTEWLVFGSSSKCEPAKNQLNTFSDVDLDCSYVSPHPLRNAASSTWFPLFFASPPPVQLPLPYTNVPVSGVAARWHVH